MARYSVYFTGAPTLFRALYICRAVFTETVRSKRPWKIQVGMLLSRGARASYGSFGRPQIKAGSRDGGSSDSSPHTGTHAATRAGYSIAISQLPSPPNDNPVTYTLLASA